ncbi:MAG: hemerythrin domain-containing protein [Gillisia sp.]
MQKPIKRHESLIPLSRDHHHGLLLSWKIRTGEKKGISTQRIYSYANYFFNSQLVPHFRLEENNVFPLLGAEDPLVKQALKEHRELESLFTKENGTGEDLTAIANLLEQHIRFEERILFTEIQNRAGEEALMNIEKMENGINTPSPDDWNDKFWLKDAV